MRPSRQVVLASCGLAAGLSPVWGFELVYRYGLWGEELPPPPRDPTVMPRVLEEALWVSLGETPGAGIEPLSRLI
jgi:hypothetical protein